MLRGEEQRRHGERAEPADNGVVGRHEHPVSTRITVRVGIGQPSSEHSGLVPGPRARVVSEPARQRRVDARRGVDEFSSCLSPKL